MDKLSEERASSVALRNSGAFNPVGFTAVGKPDLAATTLEDCDGSLDSVLAVSGLAALACRLCNSALAERDTAPFEGPPLPDLPTDPFGGPLGGVTGLCFPLASLSEPWPWDDSLFSFSTLGTAGNLA